MADALRACCFALVSAFAAGCAPEFDKVSEIETLRVLAVQKDLPYAKSGDTVNLSILWRDRPDKPARPVQVGWNKGCFNPAGDLFFQCFAPEVLARDPDIAVFDEIEQCGPPPAEPPSEPPVPCDNKFMFTLPETLGRRPRVSDPTQPRYGLTYVFFAVCAGKIVDVTQTQSLDFPFGCVDENDNRLGSDDFVAGYAAIYAFDEPLNGEPITNDNPPVSGFIFRDKPAPTSCLGDQCLSIPAEWSDRSKLHCDDAPDAPPEGSLVVPCVPPCEDDGDESCPGHRFRPELLLTGDLATYPEKDVVSNATRGRDITEQMWINYYAERGGVKSEVRLLNDAFAGVNEDFGTEFWAPKEEGPTVIWAVVHDNRGGMSWVGIPILVQAPPATR